VRTHATHEQSDKGEKMPVKEKYDDDNDYYDFDSLPKPRMVRGRLEWTPPGTLDNKLADRLKRSVAALNRLLNSRILKLTSNGGVEDGER
jgi:hypothetical protein